MKLQIERLGGGEMTLEAFADQHGLTMRVRERSRVNGLPRFYAYFDGVESTEGGMLTGTHGNGDTPEAAIAEYADLIAGRRLVLDAMRPTRREFQAPNLLTTAPKEPVPTAGIQTVGRVDKGQ